MATLITSNDGLFISSALTQRESDAVTMLNAFVLSEAKQSLKPQNYFNHSTEGSIYEDSQWFATLERIIIQQSNYSLNFKEINGLSGSKDINKDNSLSSTLSDVLNNIFDGESASGFSKFLYNLSKVDNATSEISNFMSEWNKGVIHSSNYQSFCIGPYIIKYETKKVDDYSSTFGHGGDHGVVNRGSHKDFVMIYSYITFFALSSNSPLKDCLTTSEANGLLSWRTACIYLDIQKADLQSWIDNIYTTLKNKSSSYVKRLDI